MPGEISNRHWQEFCVGRPQHTIAPNCAGGQVVVVALDVAERGLVLVRHPPFPRPVEVLVAALVLAVVVVVVALGLHPLRVVFDPLLLVLEHRMRSQMERDQKKAG